MTKSPLLLNTKLLKSFFIICSLLLISCSDKPKKQNKKTEESSTVSGKNTTAVFKWENELCLFTGTYNPEKYSKEILENTHDLWFMPSGLSTDASPNDEDRIEKLSIDELTTEYNEKKASLNRKTIETPFWNKLKTERLLELQDEYELKKLSIESYKNPSLLTHSRFSKNCSEYAEVLASNDSVALLKAWTILAEKQKKNNGSPENFMKRHLEKFNSPDRVQYAKMELKTYGWWNCAIGEIRRVEDDGKMEKEFNKLFINIKSVCDEP